MLRKRDPLNCSLHFSPPDTIYSFRCGLRILTSTRVLSVPHCRKICVVARKQGSELRMAENRARTPLQILPRGTQVHRNDRDTSFHTKKSYC
jgi:hypothetical protein